MPYRALLAFAVILSMTRCAPAPAGLFADTVYLNGTIVTMSSNSETMQAVAVRGDEIVAVGSDDEVQSLVDPDTTVVDLDGKTMVPGFYAAHDHFPGSGRVAVTSVDLNSPPIGSVETMDELVAALRERAATTPVGEWVQGRGYDTLLAERRHPTREDLDQVSTEHPIYIGHTSGHLGVANSLALELAGVTRDTPNPPGGVIQKDPVTGEPNGVFEESGGMVSRLIPPVTAEEQMEAFRWAVQDYVEEGVTTAVIAGGGSGSLVNLRKARAEGLLTFRIITMMSRGNPDQPSAAEMGGLGSHFGDNHVKVGAIKIVQDGSNQGYTGYFTEPYHTPFKGNADYHGYARRSREDLTTMVTELHRTGYQIAIHANGEAAIDDVIHAFREASFFVGHVYYWGDRHRDIFMGPDRAAGISALRSSVDRGIRFTVHDDTPVTPVNPLQLVWVSVNRLTKTGQVLGPDERITPLEALRAVTIDAAWQNFEEDIKGSIEPGKLADLVILSDNPVTVDPGTIREIRVLETIVGGQTVYAAP